VLTSIAEIAPFNEDRRYDLDMSAPRLDATYEHGHGTS